MAPPSEKVAAALKKMREGATRLDLSGNSIGAEGARHLADALKTNSMLQTLDLYNNDIGDEGARHLADALKTNSTLQELNLRSNSIGDEGARHLVDALETNSTLQKLELGMNRIGDEGARHLADVLKTKRTLQTLFLGMNTIGEQGARHLADALKTNSTLQALNLSNNSIGEQGARHLTDVLKTNSTLRLLDLSDNSIGEQGARHMADVLKMNSTLQTLGLRDNIGHEAAGHLADALKTNRTLQTLYLWGNSVGDEGAQHLANALKTNSTLQTLSLNYNDIGAEGARHLMDALKTNSGLQTLDLSSNYIGAEGARHLADALKTNSTLNTLDLGYSSIGAEGARHLADALKTNSTLHSLNLSMNSIGDEGVRHLAEALKTNSTLRRLHLSSNEIDEQGARHLADALKTNSMLQELILSSNSIEAALLAEIDAAMARNKANPPSPDNNAEKWSAALAAAVKNGDVQPWGRAKLMVVGQGAAGKSSTVRSLLGEAPVHTHESTLLMDVTRTRAGGAQFRRLQKGERDFDAQVLRAAAARVEPSTTKRTSLRKSMTQAVRKAVKHLTPPKMTTKHSASQPQAPLPALMDDAELATRFDAKRAQALHAQTKDGTHISFTLWDYGGQEVFYALHHIFLTQEGLYVLVFDMRELLGDGDEAGRYLRFWLNSIQLHAPHAPVLLVGTYLDEIADVRAVNKALRQRTELPRKYPQVVPNAKDGLLFFPIDNSSSQLNRADALRAAIVAQTVEQPYVTRPVSLRWLRVQDAMLESGKPYFALADVVELARDFGVPESEVGDMLALFHGLGVVVHLSATEALDNIVVVDPQWLIDKLVNVVSDRMHVEHLYTDPKLRASGLVEAFEDLRLSGLATRALLEHLWDGEEVEYLLNFMQENLLLCEWRFGGCTDTYLATSLLASSRSLDMSAFDGGMAAELDFSASFLPNGVFQRLVAQCATYAATQEDSMTPELTRNAAVLSFGFSTFALVALVDRIQIRCESDAESPPEVIKVLVSMLRGQLAAVFHGLKWQLLLLHDGVAVEYGALEGARARKAKKVRATQPTTKVVQLASFDAFFVEADRLGRLDDDVVLAVEQATLTALPRGIEYHVFLSNKHDFGGDLAGKLALNLEMRGLKVWLDQAQKFELNEAAMRKGVRESKCYVLLLTKGVFESATVCMEFKTALDSNKRVLLVHEANPSRPGYAPISAYIAALAARRDQFEPHQARVTDLFNSHESLAVQRRFHEERLFLAKLIRRIDQA